MRAAHAKRCRRHSRGRHAAGFLPARRDNPPITQPVLSPEVPREERDRVAAAVANLSDLTWRYKLARTIAIVGGSAAVVSWAVLAVPTYTTLLMSFPVVLTAATIGFAAITARLRRTVELTQHASFVRPDTDLDAEARDELAMTTRAIDRVAASRAVREGHLPEWQELTDLHRWQIATALAELTRARALAGDGVSALADEAARNAIKQRVEEMLRYADSVDELDRSLGELDSLVRQDAIDHHLLEAQAAVADELTPASLAASLRQAWEAIEEAVDALRLLPAA